MFSRLVKYLINLFGISSVEAKGIILLFLILSVVIFVTLLLPMLNPSGNDTWLTDQRRLDSLVEIINADTLLLKDTVRSLPGFEKKLRPVSFDPNTVTQKTMDSMGLPSWLVKRIANYRGAGGKFKTRADLSRIYGMQPYLFDRLKPFVALPDSLIPEPAAKKFHANVAASVTEPSKFDLNAADSAQLISVPGIGPVLAGRILKYRSLLGGFVYIDQLDEIFGLKSPALENLKDRCLIEDGFQPEKINVNFAAWKELARHPYIKNDLAKKIIVRRDQAGPFRTAEDLRQINAVSDSLFNRIIHYVSF